ncbi:DUF262 domain-containing HNH endonuclease family protein [Acinetobacter sp. ME22]|uniref:DUF262 domain-containing protein n=1 Tax=Acinetobacter sp. ME22 TaxID=2904802 RepID=UPI001EDB6369|nr:DUF262 domain-containing protein [Acinetobacter sp. ME22]MCG2573459.1 DUF262 domain-containing HNH endonuclease family protein [Acinetobacter sp. ME22]
MQLMGAVLRNFYEIGTLVNQSDVTDGSYSLKVPHYQRPYKWTNTEISNLIKDWKGNIPAQTVGVSNTNKYFAGSVVSVAAPDTKFHSLIDGQQRTTTLFLANFVQFILLRRLILSDIDKKRCAKLQKYNDKLAETVRYIFTDDKTLSYFSSVVVELTKIADDEAMEELHEQQNYLEKYQDLLWIPPFDSKEQYERDSYELMVNKLEDVEFYLHYDRSSFNTILKRVLAQFLVGFGDTTELYTNNIIEDKLTENERIYANALTIIVSIFKELFPKDESIKDTYRYVHFLYEKIDTFLQDVNVCVIQTANADDAYTLFEVMNDRALALDDLDLIKNQFFKKFVNTNPELDNSKMDQIIQKLDDQWGDEIFHHKNMNKTYKKLVTYLGTVYITRSTDLRNEGNEKYRLNLNNYLAMDKYTQKDIKRDFNVFETCFKILKIVKLPLKKKDNFSIVAQYENETEFKKTLYFLNALQQDGVISGLFNFTLATIETINSDFNQNIVLKFINLLIDNKVDKEKVKSELEVDEQSAIQILGKINNIHEQAKILRKSSIMANSAELPRDISRKIIEANYISSTERDLLEVKNLDLTEHLSEFESWLNSWQYKPKMLFKVKTLFASIIQYSLDANNKLIVKPVNLSVSPDSNGVMELDHMVPQNPTESSILDFNHSDRELYVNGLGNMMPLPKPNNISKSNETLEKAFEYYEAAGLADHFLIKQTKELVQEVKDDTKKAEDFFTTRKTNLINYFKQIV